MDEFRDVYVVNDRSTRKVFSRIGWACFAVLGIATVLQLAGAEVARLLNPALFNNSWFTILLTFVPIYLVAFPIGFLILKPMPSERPEQHDLSLGRLFTFLLMCVCIMYVGNLIGAGMTAGIDTLKGTPYKNPLDEVLSGWNIYANFVIVVLIAPVFEETIFRKFLIDRVRCYGEGTAIVLSGLLFGLFHGNLSQFFYAFGLGSMFAYIYLRTGKVRYTITLHAIINFFGGVVSMLMVKYMNIGSIPDFSPSNPQALIDYAMKNPASVIAFGIYLLVIMLAFIAGLILLLENRKKATLLPAEKQLPKGEGFRTVWLNAGMIVFSLLALGIIVCSAIEI